MQPLWLGPFELTKLSAQVSVLMADKKNCPRPESHAIAASYQNKGTFNTFKNIIKHRGFSGLYTGFNLHLRESKSRIHSCSDPATNRFVFNSAGYPGHRYLLYDVREQ